MASSTALILVVGLLALQGTNADLFEDAYKAFNKTITIGIERASKIGEAIQSAADSTLKRFELQMEKLAEGFQDNIKKAEEAGHAVRECYDEFTSNWQKEMEKLRSDMSACYDEGMKPVIEDIEVLRDDLSKGNQIVSQENEELSKCTILDWRCRWNVLKEGVKKLNEIGATSHIAKLTQDSAAAAPKMQACGMKVGGTAVSDIQTFLQEGNKCINDKISQENKQE